MDVGDLNLDYSNSSIKDLKSFLQATLNQLFPNSFLFMKTPTSDWTMSGYRATTHNQTNFIIKGVNNIEQGIYKYKPTIVPNLNGRKLTFAGNMKNASAVGDGRAQPKITLQMSKDGATWVNLYSGTGNAVTTTSAKTFSFSTDLSDNYHYIRILFGFNVYQSHLCSNFSWTITTLQIN